MIALRQVNSDEIFRFDNENKDSGTGSNQKNYRIIPFEFQEYESPRVNKSPPGRVSFPVIAVATLLGLIHAKESYL
jgi:hypothetical protein